MQNHYTLIDECLLALRQCDIPAMPKLRLEVQIFQIKLLLLRDDVEIDIRRRFCSEASLHKIHQQMTGLARCDARDASIDAVALDLQRIAFDLAEAVTKAHARSGKLD